MPEQHPPDQTADVPVADNPLDAGLAAAFGPDSGPPLHANGSVVRALGAASHVHLRDPEGEALTPVARPGSANMPVSHDPAGRLQLHGEIARGGMGAVLKGRDTDLGRDIAVKVLLETHQGKTELVQRFVEEAQIAGQLQHPGVAPVYELGQFADKRPYFTMKLVKGKTLAALLASRKEPAEDQSKYMGIFAQVCQTLAYAHARGVIHRDLKPANVMVGAFGEVQVMDWGLAKVLAEGGVADEQKAQMHHTVSVIRTQRSQGSSAPEGIGSHTVAGSMLGTPAYMAPEQARGEVELIDERADVFGLGGILCEILTGQPPYTGKKAEVQRRAQTASLDDAYARLDGCGADGELVGLAKRCLAAEPWDRPRDAGQVTEAVTAYQNSVAERLRQTELERAAEQARAGEAKATAAAEQRARRRTVGLAAAVLGLVVVGAAGGLWVQRLQAERYEAAARQRQAAEAALDKLPGLLKQWRWQEAETVLSQAEDLLGSTGPADLLARAAQARTDLDLAVRLDAIRQRRGTIVVTNDGSLIDETPEDRDYTAAFAAAGIVAGQGDEEAAAVWVRSSAIREQLVASLDEWALSALWFNWEEATPHRQALLTWAAAVARRVDPDEWRDRLRDPNVWKDEAALQSLAEELLQDGRKLQAQSPPVLAGLGMALIDVRVNAVPLLTAAWRRNPNDVWVNHSLGCALAQEKKWEEALGYFRTSLALRPETPMAHNALGMVLKNKGQLEEAIQEFREVVRLNPKLPWGHINLGSALQRKGERDEALKEYREAVRLVPKQAWVHSSFGYHLNETSQVEEALQEFREAVRLNPKRARAHVGLGDVLKRKGERDEALKEYCTAVQIEPKNPMAHLSVGYALLDWGQLDEALQAFHEAVRLDPKDAWTHVYLGIALGRKGEREEAAREYREAIHLDPTNATAHSNLGSNLRDKGQLEEALQEYREALRLDPTHATAQRSLRGVLIQQGRIGEVKAAWQKALAANPSEHEAWFGYAELCLFLGQEEEYHGACRALLDRFGASTDPRIAARTGRACLLLPTSGDELRQATVLIDRAVTAQELRHEVFKPWRLFAKGLAEYRAGRLDSAIALMTGEASKVPWPATRLVLAMAQHRQGHKEEARQTLATAILSYYWAAGTARDHDAWICHILRREAEALILPDLPAFLLGSYQPRDQQERIAFLGACQFKALHSTATRLYADIFAADAKLADDLKAQHRYNAACGAALAAAGQGTEAARLDEKERASLRGQALEWLRADLLLYAKLEEKGQPADRKLIAARMQHWRQDADLVGLRDPDAVAKLPAEEQEACRKLWDEVEAVLRKTESKK
jgi:serine/threonine-protein kinase